MRSDEQSLAVQAYVVLALVDQLGRVTSAEVEERLAGDVLPPDRGEETRLHLGGLLDQDIFRAMSAETSRLPRRQSPAKSGIIGAKALEWLDR